MDPLTYTQETAKVEKPTKGVHVLDILQSSFKIPAANIESAYRDCMQNPQIWREASDSQNFFSMMEKFGIWALKDAQGNVYKLHTPAQLQREGSRGVLFKALAKHCEAGSFIVCEDAESRAVCEFRGGEFFAFPLDPRDEIEVDFGV